MNPKHDHTHIGIWITIFILGLILFLNNSILPTQQDSNNDIIQNSIFIFNSSEIKLYNQNLDLVKPYDGDELPPGMMRTYNLKINSTKNIVCVESLFENTRLVNSTKVNIPFEFTVNEKNSDVGCFNFKPNEWETLIVEQRWLIENEENFVYITLWN